MSINELNAFHGNEESRLFIIGNGFDLFHGIDSKFKDFYLWLMSNNQNDFIHELEHIFPDLGSPDSDCNNESLWSNFEEALGNYNINKIYEYYYIGQPQMTHSINDWKIAAELTAKKLERLCEKIRPLIKEWAEQIKIEHIKQKIDILNPKSKYLTFNYTKVLEDIYHIPKENICHIHGVVDEYQELVIGHNFDNSPENISKAYSDEEESAKQHIIKILNRLNKNTDYQIDSNITFFLSLDNITDVIVIGHSLTRLDLRYFGEVMSSTPKNVFWYFTTHTDNDTEKIEKFICPSRFQNPRIKEDYYSLINI